MLAMYIDKDSMSMGICQLARPVRCLGGRGPQSQAPSGVEVDRVVELRSFESVYDLTESCLC